MSQFGTHSYLFVRYDLSIEQTIIQTNHATHAMAYSLVQTPDDVVPHLVLIGVPNQKALERVIQKLHDNCIEFSSFVEPDNDLGLTAVATVPLTAEQREILANYKLWSEDEFKYARSSVGQSAPVVNGEVGGSIPSARANLSPLNPMTEDRVAPGVGMGSSDHGASQIVPAGSTPAEGTTGQQLGCVSGSNPDCPTMRG